MRMRKTLHRATCGCLMCAMAAASLHCPTESQDRVSGPSLRVAIGSVFRPAGHTPEDHHESSEAAWYNLNPTSITSTATAIATPRFIGYRVHTTG